MSDGREVKIGVSNNLIMCEWDSFPPGIAYEDGLAFTLPELATHDEAIRAENRANDAAMISTVAEIHAQGFAAGVEAAIELATPFPYVNPNLILHLRALLPPEYKSPAKIRREALEEAARLACTWCANPYEWEPATKRGDGIVHFCRKQDSNSPFAAYAGCQCPAIHRALAEAEGGE